MPYPTNESLPATVRKLPAKGQRMWRHVWTSEYDRHHDEDRAFGAAWAAVERAGYKPAGKVAGEMGLQETTQSLFLPIVKVDDEQRFIEAYASTERVDEQGQIMTREAMKTAWPDYFKWANLREMHSNSAAGTVLAADLDDPQGIRVGAKIVDDQAWRKVKEGVYKGLSVGGKILAMRPDASAPNGVIEKIRLTEISLVDRPANPDAVITMFKFADDGKPVAIPPLSQDDVALMLTADYLDGDSTVVKFLDADGSIVTLTFDQPVVKREISTKERKDADESDFAGPHRSFPILKPEDVGAAAHSLGRAGDKSAIPGIKRRIIAIARRKGWTAQLPKEWRAKKDGGTLDDEEAAAMGKSAEDLKAERDAALAKAAEDMSHEDKVREAREALQAKHPMHGLVATHEDHIIHHDYSGNYFKSPVSWVADKDGDGGRDAELGDPEPVEHRFVSTRARKMAVQQAEMRKRAPDAALRIQSLHDEASLLGAVCPSVIKIETNSGAPSTVAGTATQIGHRPGQDDPGAGSGGGGGGDPDHDFTEDEIEERERIARLTADAARTSADDVAGSVEEKAAMAKAAARAAADLERAKAAKAAADAKKAAAGAAPTASSGITLAQATDLIKASHVELVKALKDGTLDDLAKRVAEQGKLVDTILKSPKPGGPALSEEALRAAGLRTVNRGDGVVRDERGNPIAKVESLDDLKKRAEDMRIEAATPGVSEKERRRLSTEVALIMTKVVQAEGGFAPQYIASGPVQ